jgi:hypothetical protein
MNSDQNKTKEEKSERGDHERPPGHEVGEQIKQFLTGAPATYSEDEEPRTVEKEQMSAPEEEYVQDKPPPSEDSQVER